MGHLLTYLPPKMSVTENLKWFELSDLLAEIQSLKLETEYAVALAYFDLPTVIAPVIAKFPSNVQAKWVAIANNYRQSHNVCFPPLTEFAAFVHEQVKNQEQSQSSICRLSETYNNRPQISKTNHYKEKQHHNRRQYCFKFNGKLLSSSHEESQFK